VDEGSGRRSVAFAPDWWWPACQSRDLGRRPVPITLMDRPLVLFRDGVGTARAVVDRCAHRNVALSLGRVHEDGCLECPYHGWRYDGSGRCTAVPGLLGIDADATARTIGSHHVRERHGFVWVWGRAGADPVGDPFPLPRHEGRTGQVVFGCDLESTLHAAIENTLDVPHTAFLHRGIFRGRKEKDVTAERRDLEDGVEVRFMGEPVGIGPIQGGPLAGKVFEHWDRFFLPGIAQVEYRVEDWLRITNTVLHLPMSPTLTRAWFVLRWTSPLPAAVVKPIVLAQGRFVLRQDARMLAAQSAQIERFGGERFASTELDLLGSAIWRLLRRAERNGAGDANLDPEDPPTPEATIHFTA